MQQSSSQPNHHNEDHNAMTLDLADKLYSILLKQLVSTIMDNTAEEFKNSPSQSKLPWECMREEEDRITTGQSIWLKSHSKPSSECITFQIQNSHNRIMNVSSSLYLNIIERYYYYINELINIIILYFWWWYLF